MSALGADGITAIREGGAADKEESGKCSEPRWLFSATIEVSISIAATHLPLKLLSLFQ